MGRIPDEIIEQIRDTADLLEVVQESVQLKRTGSDWRGPCPFHGGTNRNFAVVPKKNLYHCFVCHASGDVFTWYRERFGMDYPSAVREVARKYGIVVPETAERTGPDPREPLYSACDAARDWYAKRLREGNDAESARRYLLGRELSLDAAAEQSLGWAPNGGDFIAAMTELGIEESALEEAALIQRREDGSTFPRFRNRLLFPIHDLRGRVVGFGGRLLGGGEPKYLNSPETPIFHKGEQLYHIHVAKQAIRKAGVAIVVEGYFDVIRLSLAGIDNVVAPLGTAFTEAQAKLIRRYTDEVIICYDSDPAGLRATFRAGDVLLAAGCRVRVVTMPSGDDPDTVVQRGGEAELKPLLDNAVDVLERKLQLLELKGWFADAHKSREALDRLLPTLRASSDPVTREIYVSLVAESLQVPRSVVSEEADRRPSWTATVSIESRGNINHSPAPHEQMQTTRSGGGRIPRTPGAEIERKLLRLLLQNPEWVVRAKEEVSPDRFQVASFRKIYEALVELPAGAAIADAADSLDERTREVWSRLDGDDSSSDGLDVDLEYVGSLEALEEIHSFPDVASETDPLEMRRRWQAMSRAGQARFRLYLAMTQRPQSGRRDPVPEE